VPLIDDVCDRSDAKKARADQRAHGGRCDDPCSDPFIVSLYMPGAQPDERTGVDRVARAAVRQWRSGFREPLSHPASVSAGRRRLGGSGIGEGYVP
jgi:hypothetical protein